METYGRPRLYVRGGPSWAGRNISEVAEFVVVAEHLERRGWIAEADAGYCIFVLTPEGTDDEAQNQRTAGRRVSCGRRARVL